MDRVEELCEKLRALCLSLPETSETAAWGHPNFRAGKRTFAVFEEYLGRPCIAVKVGFPDAEVLAADPRFFRTPYSGKHGWISLRVARPVPWKLVEGLVLRSYRGVAPKRAVAALDAAPSRSARRAHGPASRRQKGKR